MTDDETPTTALPTDEEAPTTALPTDETAVSAEQPFAPTSAPDPDWAGSRQPGGDAVWSSSSLTPAPERAPRRRGPPAARANRSGTIPARPGSGGPQQGRPALNWK